MYTFEKKKKKQIKVNKQGIKYKKIACVKNIGNSEIV